MKKSVIFIGIILCAAANSFAQQIIRSSLSSFGNTAYDNGIIFRQTVGQPSNTTVCSGDKTLLRQGFQQPVSAALSNSTKERECTLYLSPNPASENVSIKFAEEIGEKQISVFDMLGKQLSKISDASPSYVMDISRLPKGVYLVNVISKSGYHCNQKLVVL